MLEEVAFSSDEVPPWKLQEPNAIARNVETPRPNKMLCFVFMFSYSLLLIYAELGKDKPRSAKKVPKPKRVFKENALSKNKGDIHA